VDTLKRNWLAVGALYVANLVVTVFLERILNAGIENQLVNDIAIAVVACLAIATPVLWLIWRERASRVPLEAGPQSASAQAFDPYAIVNEIAGMDLSGLYAAESFIMIAVNVRNVSGHPVKITGVKGRIRCCGEECNIPPTVEPNPVSLSVFSYDHHRCAIRQPLGDGMMQVIKGKGIYGDGLLSFSLDGLSWLGTVTTPAGDAPLLNCYLPHEVIIVQGPVRCREDGHTMFRASTRFMSSNWYSSDGQPKTEG
jgi:hypothetical protein